eukprot:CAMPEP_0185724024 /NCGR_PEP_ID=MMETSP1171-20130828/644_1 /TAXON_ID=374046 /ORGANISM="Helicotheca tamensis, Strain CCMP826" /LENGTH=105 /DNA_ID=CAMNT_0028391797 /DNA_START=95 /DNA_END=412 /DNA_ORIENTATION=+
MAFAPPSASVARPAFKTATLAMSQVSEQEANPKVAALAAFATALTPLITHAEEVSDEIAEAAPAVAAAASAVDEATLIGYGSGLVACVVFFAVGFSIGYGTLVKP